MGIEDRDYYRDLPSGNFWNRLGGTTLLIFGFGIVFLLQLLTTRNGRSELVDQFILRPNLFLKGEIWRLFTYALLHSDILSLIFTILFLIWFARPIEEQQGTIRFLIFFVLTTVLSAGAYFGVAILSGVQAELYGPSALILSLLMLTALRDPRKTILLFFVIPIPIWGLMILYALVDMAGLFGGKNPSILVVHIAAGLFAFVYHSYALRGTRLLPIGGEHSPIRSKNRQKLRIYQEAPLPESQPPYLNETTDPEPPPPLLEFHGLDEHLEAKVDELLEKISKHGQQSLTEQERNILKQAGEIIRNRRKKS
ncbi:MAG: rhomboid family intramembrane serine protease [Gemmataceae bacterium]|jgi:membrane associated rhomboid family serine protease|nr:rhomboid family intramembrane serine protease [Gemmataceae bacterium]